MVEEGDPRALAPRPPHARDRLLDATVLCLRRHGIRRTTVAAVADEAGLSRAYLYRLFPDKPTLLAAALIRRDETFWAEADERVTAAAGLAAQVAVAVDIARRSPLGPLAMELKESEPEAFAAVMGTFAHDIVPGMSGFWRRHLERAAELGELRPGLDLDAAAEWVLRVVISLVGVPGEAVDVDDPASIRAHLETFLLPALAPAPTPALAPTPET